MSTFRVLTVALLARRLGVTAERVHAMVREGCPCDRDEEDGGRLYFDQAEVERWRTGGQANLFGAT